MSDIVAVLEHHEVVGILVKTHLAVADPDPEIRGGGAVLKKNFFRPFGPQFGLKIRGGRASPGPSPGSATAHALYMISRSPLLRPKRKSLQKKWKVEAEESWLSCTCMLIKSFLFGYIINPKVVIDLLC